MSTALHANHAFTSSPGQHTATDAFGMAPWSNTWLQHVPHGSRLAPQQTFYANGGTTQTANFQRPASSASYAAAQTTPGFSDSSDSGVGFISGEEFPSRSNTSAGLDLFGQRPFTVDTSSAISSHQNETHVRRNTVAPAVSRTGKRPAIVHDSVSQTSAQSVWEQAARASQHSVYQSGFMSSHQASPFPSPPSATTTEVDDPSRFFPPDAEFVDGLERLALRQASVDEFGMTRLTDAIPQESQSRQMSSFDVRSDGSVQGASAHHLRVSGAHSPYDSTDGDASTWRVSSDEDRSSEASEGFSKHRRTAAPSAPMKIVRRTSHTFEGPAQLPRSPDNLFRRHPPDNHTWHLMYKPNTGSQAKVTQAIWMPVVAVLGEDSVIYVYEHNPSMDNRDGSVDPTQLAQTFPLLELRLRQQMAFTSIVRRRVDRVSRTRVHSTKIQVLEHTEKRRASVLFAISHEPERRTLLKIGSYDLLLLESFIEAVNESLRQLPLELRPQTVFRKNEVFVDCLDKCTLQMDYDGKVLSRLSTVQVMVQGFLTGLPECELLMNDSKRRSNNHLPVSRHVIMMDREQLHPAVNHQLFDAHHRIRFRCMEAIRFEAIRFQVTGSLPPPLVVASLHCESMSDVVNLQVTLQWQPNAGQVRFALQSVEWHFPVPNSWHSILVTRTPLGFRSVKSSSSLRGNIHRNRRTQQASINVNVGTAKYEPENSAIVWRIDEFPSAKDAQATFVSQLLLMPGMTRTDFIGETGTLRYTVTGSCISGTQIWGLLVPTTTNKQVKKWVRYETEFRHQVNLRPPPSVLAAEDD